MTEITTTPEKALTIRLSLDLYDRLRQLMLDRREPTFQGLIVGLLEAWAQGPSTAPAHPITVPIPRTLPRPDLTLLSTIGATLETLPGHKPLRDSLRSVIALSVSSPEGPPRRPAG